MGGPDRGPVWWKGGGRRSQGRGHCSDREVTRLVGIRPPEIFTMAQALDEQALCYTVQEFLDRFQEG